jgi:N-acetylglucosamine-6-phosphate deacetylase
MGVQGKIRQLKGENSAMKITGNWYRQNKPVQIEVSDDGFINSIEWMNDANLPQEQNLFLAPGFIDNQVNGYKGVDFTSDGLTVEQITEAVKAFWEQGVTTILPTIITASHETILNSLNILSEARKNPEITSSIAGYHLEGPYISPEDGYRGAHPKKHVRLPNWDEFQQYIEAADNHILQISLAPEVEGAIPFIKKCREHGIIVALAHHNAPAEKIREAVDAGAAISTHLGNGCANEINRRENVFWPQLAEDRLTASMICDGIHLLPDQIRTFYKIKGADRIILTSDVVFIAGLKPGIYDYSGEKVELTKEGMIINNISKVFAGASFPLYKGIEHIMEVTGCPLDEALKMATINHAALLNLNDRGELKVGKRADFVIFQMKNNKIFIKETYVGGKRVFSAEQ